MSATIRELAEVRVPGPVPRWEIPEWRERFGLVAGITGRGDATHGPDGFDLGLSTGAPVGDVMRRWREFFETVPGFPSATLSMQVHGIEFTTHDGPPDGWTITHGFDGQLAWDRGILLLATVADCIPVYLFAPAHGWTGLLHVGWRGLAGGLLEEVVAFYRGDIEEFELDDVELIMHCGVGISGGCYEVGDEVALACGKRPAPSGKQFLDLRKELVERASELDNISEITVSPHCTATMADAFFSHRRSGGRDGRQVAYFGRPEQSDDTPLHSSSR